jgi:ATP-dependent DNA ligase
MAKVMGGTIQYSRLFTDPKALLKACEERGMEGIVCKNTSRPYVSGKTHHWLKVKCPGWRERNQWRQQFFSKQQ